MIPNHDPETKLPAYIQNVVDGKTTTNYGRGIPINDGSEPARTLIAEYRSKGPNELVNIPERSKSMNNFNLTPQQPANGFTVLELFCGGGLGAIGFKAAGYDIVKALDFDKNAVKAYRHNFGDHVEQADINAVDIDDIPNTDVIFGGPPCQDFSVAGKGAGADGVAQKRERVFIVGIRKDLGFMFEFPKPLEGDYQTRVLRDVIGELPEANNEGYGLRNDEKPYAHKIPDGGNWRNLPVEEQKAFMKGAYYSGGGQTTYLRRLSEDEPALTVTASIMAKATCHLHPIEPGKAPRRFTVRECLRIQSAPDTYVLPDDISLSAQYRIVGNGIASRVAWYIGCSLADQLRFKSKA
ncbi:DNA cytosine methyltransferase [Bacillus siamensis]|uniref:DNA cytosine methyltransferase n=1 Tax=Bacillus siamensis TaxID=659243 RepID=UPI002E2518A4|nr:DNA cytosine methyltransferase [Bacillus siamensis]MED5047638.1 DNA cytosine methyltransferase [Bacillus siamensis]MED5097111.1 DNA cytosine methyltransferase [Bacillus siamensis]